MKSQRRVAKKGTTKKKKSSRPKSVDAQDIVARVLKLGSSVRVATVCNSDGKLVFHARSRSVENLLSQSESEESLRISARNMKGRKKLERKLGKVQYALVEYQRLKRIVLPVDNRHYLFVTCTTRFDHNKIVKAISSFK